MVRRAHPEDQCALEGGVTPHRACKQTHMTYAGHRFDSGQKPLVRCVLYFPALIATLERVVQLRRGESEAHAAGAFLSWLDAEKALQLAMMADAGEGHMDCLRLFDYEGFPTEDLAFNLSAFMERLRYMFLGARGRPPL